MISFNRGSIRSETRYVPAPVLNVEIAPNARVVSFSESATFDVETAAMFGPQFDKLLTLGTQPIIIDLQNVTHVGSTGLGELLMFHRQAELIGVPVVLCNASRTLRRSLEISQLHSRFTLLPSRDAALAHLSLEAGRVQ